MEVRWGMELEKRDRVSGGWDKLVVRLPLYMYDMWTMGEDLLVLKSQVPGCREINTLGTSAGNSRVQSSLSVFCLLSVYTVLKY
jgi:hypothetical protein